MHSAILLAIVGLLAFPLALAQCSTTPDVISSNSQTCPSQDSGNSALVAATTDFSTGSAASISCYYEAGSYCNYISEDNPSIDDGAQTFAIQPSSSSTCAQGPLQGSSTRPAIPQASAGVGQTVNPAFAPDLFQCPQYLSVTTTSGLLYLSEGTFQTGNDGFNGNICQYNSQVAYAFCYYNLDGTLNTDSGGAYNTVCPQIACPVIYSAQRRREIYGHPAYKRNQVESKALRGSREARGEAKKWRVDR